MTSSPFELVPDLSGLTRRPARSIRARRHPWAVAILWAWQLPFALVVAAPASALVASTYGRGAGGDAVIWVPGGRALMSFAFQQAPALRAIGTLAAIAWGSWLVLGIVPMAIAMVAMAYAVEDASSVARTPSFTTCGSVGLRIWPKLLKLLVAFALAEGLLLGLGGGAAVAAMMWTHGVLGEARSQHLGLFIGVLFLVAAVVLHVVHDLSRAFLVFAGGRELGAIYAAVVEFRRAPLALCLSWAWRASVALAMVLAGSMLAQAIGSRGGFGLALIAVADQVIVLARASLRASWLAHVLRDAANAPPEAVG